MYTSVRRWPCALRPWTAARAANHGRRAPDAVATRHGRMVHDPRAVVPWLRDCRVSAARCGRGDDRCGCVDVTAVVARTVTPRLYRPFYVIIMVVAATMASMDDHERKIVVEFCQLLEQSKQLFNGLRWVVVPDRLAAPLPTRVIDREPCVRYVDRLLAFYPFRFSTLLNNNDDRLSDIFRSTRSILYDRYASALTNATKRSSDDV